MIWLRAEMLAHATEGSLHVPSRGFGEVGGLDQWRMTPGLAGDGRRLLLQVSRHSCAVKDLRWKKNGAGERGYM